jgi:hypothetical protein
MNVYFYVNISEKSKRIYKIFHKKAQKYNKKDLKNIYLSDITPFRGEKMKAEREDGPENDFFEPYEETD